MANLSSLGTLTQRETDILKLLHLNSRILHLAPYLRTTSFYFNQPVNTKHYTTARNIFIIHLITLVKIKPAISREVINDPVYTLSTASPCSSCNLGTAFPDAIISSIRGVAPNLQSSLFQLLAFFSPDFHHMNLYELHHMILYDIT